MAQNKRRKGAAKYTGKPKTKRIHNHSPAIKGEVVVCDEIEKITLANFIRCVVNNNYSVLRISGEPSMHQLFIAWIKILSAHYTLIEDKQQLKYIKFAAKMEALNLKITVVKYLCEALRAWYDERLINCLRNPTDKGGWGYKLSYSPDTVLADIDMTLTLLSNDEFKLIKMKTEYGNEQKAKKKKGEAPTKNFYMKILYAIEKYRAPCRYRAEEITLYEFDMFYNELKEYNEALEEQSRNVNKNYRKKDGTE
jgi:hypothetical protein